ncbi:hypothetical protein C8R46DRAFT_1139392 [Mycena filopes]|nr:hypothetical protein C8R46DRAFT_1139392 [Mycena filopes]
MVGGEGGKLEVGRGGAMISGVLVMRGIVGGGSSKWVWDDDGDDDDEGEGCTTATRARTLRSSSWASGKRARLLTSCWRRVSMTRMRLSRELAAAVGTAVAGVGTAASAESSSRTVGVGTGPETTGMGAEGAGGAMGAALKHAVRDLAALSTAVSGAWVVEAITSSCSRRSIAVLVSRALAAMCSCALWTECWMDLSWAVKYCKT